MIKTSTIQLLRFPFSFFLMPVYWYAISLTEKIDISNAVLVFVILHLLLYPSSNGYNSYMDRDTGSIGGIARPKQPTKQLFRFTVIMDGLAIVLGALVSLYFMYGILAFILASRAYSYRGIRLKKYAVAGYLTVIIFQGGLIFFLVIHGCSMDKTVDVPLPGMITSSLLIGSFYPLTQIYQHEDDAADGVMSMSRLLGYRGSFYFTAVIFLLAMTGLFISPNAAADLRNFLVVQIFFVPVLVYFVWWFQKVYINNDAANYTNTMRMNILASVCSNCAFITLLILQKY